MKQYLDAVQTSHLMQLGFPAPKSVSKLSLDLDMDTIPTFNYSIGELIELLPSRIGVWDLDISRDYCYERWICHYDPGTEYGVATELIDALYNLILKLKEERVIWSYGSTKPKKG